jgi:HEAT repeat protein
VNSQSDRYEPIGRLKQRMANQTADLLEALENGKRLAKISAAFALVRTVPPSTEIEEALFSALGDPDRFVRGAAAAALAELDRNRPAEPILQRLREAEGTSLTLMARRLRRRSSSISFCSSRASTESRSFLRRCKVPTPGSAS